VEVFSHFFPRFGPVTIRLENVEWETDVEPKNLAFERENGKSDEKKKGEREFPDEHELIGGPLKLLYSWFDI
jgi:hypothetical protein